MYVCMYMLYLCHHFMAEVIFHSVYTYIILYYTQEIAVSKCMCIHTVHTSYL